MNVPDATSVSTRVNPVAKRPSSYAGLHVAPVFCHFTSSNVTSSSLPREPNDSDSKCPSTFSPTWSASGSRVVSDTVV